MATTTTNLQLKKPAATDKVAIADINGNMDILDAAVAGKQPKGDYALKSEIPSQITVDSALDGTSTNPVQNKVVNQSIYNLGVQLRSEIPDVSGYVTGEDPVTITDTVPPTFGGHTADEFVLKTELDEAETGYVQKTGATMEGALVAQTNTNYSTRQMRNMIISTSSPSGGASGDIWIKYSN